MNILFINKFLRHVGGAETVFFDEWRWLEAEGHTIIPFGMAHPDNIESEYKHHWVEQIDYGRPTLGQLRDMIWSREAARKLRGLIEETRPDIAHLHNIYHQLSPSILATLKQAGIPAILTAHDYKLICPNYRLYTQGQPCERCVQSHTWHAVRHACQKNSRAASTLVALESGIHRFRQAYSSIDHFIAPSQFVRQKLIEGGIPSQKVSWLPHAVARFDKSPYKATRYSDTFLFAGRLEPEKGVRFLIELAQRLPHLAFWIAGTGSLFNEIQNHKLANVRLLGKLPRLKLEEVRQGVTAELIPSLWYEVFGMSAVEAMQAGLPVLASRLGGLVDVVQDGKTGLLLPAGDIPVWTKATTHLAENNDYAQQMGRSGREYALKQFNPHKHTQTLLELYERVSHQPVSLSAKS